MGYDNQTPTQRVADGNKPAFTGRMVRIHESRSQRIGKNGDRFVK